MRRYRQATNDRELSIRTDKILVLVQCDLHIIQWQMVFGSSFDIIFRTGSGLLRSKRRVDPSPMGVVPSPMAALEVKHTGDIKQNMNGRIWAIYNDLSRGHPKWWFSKGIPPKMALNQVKDL